MNNPITEDNAPSSVEELALYIADVTWVRASSVAMFLSISSPNRFDYETVKVAVLRAIVCGDLEAIVARLPGVDTAAPLDETAIDGESTLVSAQALVKWGHKFQPFPTLLQLIDAHLDGKATSQVPPSVLDDSLISQTLLPAALKAFQDLYTGSEQRPRRTNDEIKKHLMETLDLSQTELDAIVAVIKPRADKRGGRPKAAP